ncbi:MAG: hypothetical protein GQ570_00830 [Helicobacteraceae bacterium]|nr:hypothetical protein [Helicobacteraceae bacterium]
MSLKYFLDTNIDISAIFFWGRSGSFFLGSLLDNHKNIMTIPGGYLFNFYGENGFWQKIINNNISDFDILLDTFIKDHRGAFDGKYDKGSNFEFMGDDSVTCLSVDVEKFKISMKKYHKKYNLFNRKLFFIASHYSYEIAQGNDVLLKKLINYQLHTPASERVSEFCQDFPNAKYLGTYREPVRALYSHIKQHKGNLQENNESKLYEEYHTVYDGQYGWYYKHQLIGWKKVAHDYKLLLLAVKLEKLHDNPKKVLKKIAKFLNIDFEDSLMQSTFCGLKYWGDNRAVGKINGFSSSHTKTSTNEKCFNTHDLFVLNTLSALKHKEYKYLLEDSEYMGILEDMIEVPTKIEKEALDKSLNIQEHKSAFLAYKQRVKDSIWFLNSSKKIWKLNNG